MTYRKKLDEVMMGHARLISDEFDEEEKMRIVEHGLPKKMCNPGNFVLPVRANGMVEMSTLADTGQVHAYYERLSKLQGKEIGTPIVADWTLFYSYIFDETLKNKMKFEYIHRDGVVFEDYSWERDLSISRNFVVLLVLNDKDELKHHLFAINFTKLEVDDRLFNHDAYLQQIRTSTRTNLRTSLIMEPIMRIMHRLLVGSLVHKCEKWTSKMVASELDEDVHTLLQTTRVAPEPREGSRQRQEQTGLSLSWGDWNAFLNEIEYRDVWRELMLMRNNYMFKHSRHILHRLADQSDCAYPIYEPPNVPPYPYPCVLYPHPYTHYAEVGNQSYRGEHYGEQGDAYYVGYIVPSIGYKIGGSSRGVHGDDDEDDMSDQYMR
uniref:Uncharacterized protein n=1 Tax=Tanacetum cinerariifolium TaxID=118510 RepID=A0A6L2JLV7_TANCI|nr:hypothetical protein [Tanacetum cinerariifolium]